MIESEAEIEDLRTQLAAALEEAEHYKRQWLHCCQSSTLKAITIKVAIGHITRCREKLAGIAPKNYIEALDGFIRGHSK